tara:strand:+ start:1329 stop:1556 length:228 start_codon:yes stop_codon:yes gene_type:complete
MVETKPLIEFLNKTMPRDNLQRAFALECSLEMYRKLLYREKISLYKADEYATALGRHPIDIWNDWYEITDRDACA